jgi:hypothetical protein
MESTSYIKRSSRRKRVKQPKAYILGGHGDERGDETFIVPPGCIIVVKTYAGSTTKAYSFLEKGLCSLTPTILKNPIVHYDELERVLGPLAIYQPGDTCPHFHYNLLQCYQMSNVYWKGCNSFGSGVMDVDRMYEDNELLQCTRKMESYNRRLQNENEFGKLDQSRMVDHDSVYDSIYPYFSKLYQHSVFPNPQDIEIIIHNAIDDGSNNLDTMLEYIGDEVSTTQEELCSLFPGVYYHVICRATPAGMNLFHSSVNEIDQIPSRVTYVTSKPHIRNLLGKHIGEAAVHRAPYIRSMYEKRYATPADIVSSVKQGPSRSTLRRRQQRLRQKQRHNKTIKNNK